MKVKLSSTPIAPENDSEMVESDHAVIDGHVYLIEEVIEE